MKSKILLFSLFSFFFVPFITKADSQFPNDAITRGGAYNSSSYTAITVPSGNTYTILQVCDNPFGSSDVRFIFAGQENFNSADATKSTPNSNLQMHCINGLWKLNANQTLLFTQQGGTPWNTFFITYVPYDLSLVPSEQSELHSLNNTESISGGWIGTIKTDVETISGNILSLGNGYGHIILAVIEIILFLLVVRWLWKFFFYGI